MLHEDSPSSTVLETSELFAMNEKDVGTLNVENHITKILKEYDKDKTGYIEEEELKEMLKDDNEVSRQIVKNIFNGSDNNQDNRLDFDEFVGMVQNRSYKKFFKKYVNIYIRFILPPSKRRAGTIDDPDAAYEEQYSCYPPPIAILIITAFELACFMIDESSQTHSTTNGTNGVTARLLIYDPNKRKEFWRFFTYIFVHIGYTHLLVNLAVQVLLGVPLEMVHKWWRVLSVYFCGVIAGSLGSSIMDPMVGLAGASGGVYALLTAHVGTIIMNWHEMSLGPILLIIYSILIVVDIGTSIYNRYWLRPEDQVSYSAHIAGALVGLLVGLWVLKNIVPSKRENYIWWIALILFVLIMGTMILLNVFWTNHFLT